MLLCRVEIFARITSKVFRVGSFLAAEQNDFSCCLPNGQHYISYLFFARRHSSSSFCMQFPFPFDLVGCPSCPPLSLSPHPLCMLSRRSCPALEMHLSCRRTAREFVHFAGAVCTCFVENVNKIQALIPYLDKPFVRILFSFLCPCCHIINYTFYNCSVSSESSATHSHGRSLAAET